MDIEYITKIQKWVEMDNRIMKNKEDIKDIIQNKKELEDEILEYVESKKYDKLTVNISDGNIKFAKRNTTQPLSMKTLRVLLDKYIGEHGSELNTISLIKYISDNLETKQKLVMKREVNGIDQDD